MGAVSVGDAAGEMPVLLGPRGEAALALAARQDDPGSLAAATTMRAVFDPELAAAALTQTALRRRAVGKLGERAAGLFLTPEGLEQASRASVSAWRAARLVGAGVERVVDLGCGVGADALGFADAGLDVLAVEIDPLTAAYARANLAGRGEVRCGDAVALAGELLARPDPRRAVFVDPARRTGAGRSWRLEDLRPSWGFVLGLIEAGHRVVVKLGPGFDRGLVPTGVDACWVSDHGDAVELGLWRLRLDRREPDSPGRRSAVALPSDQELAEHPDAPPLTVAPVGAYLLAPDGVVGRAGLLPELAAALAADVGSTVWRLDAAASYLSSDAAPQSPFVTCFQVLETFAFTEKALRAWARARYVGALEIKVQGFALDPAALRRRLRLDGPSQASVVLAHTTAGATVVVCRRV